SQRSAWPRSPACSSVSGPRGVRPDSTPSRPSAARDRSEVDLLAIMAPPDAHEALSGGPHARAVEAGDRVGAIALTRGESGTWGSSDGRAREAQAAADILGLTVRANAGLPDAALENTSESRLVVAAHLRTLRPRTVILHWPDHGRHPDHRVASQLA